MHGRPGYCDAFKPVPNGAALFPHFLFELCVSGCMIAPTPVFMRL